MNRILTATQARSITDEVSAFVDAQADLDKSLWADRCHVVQGKYWEEEFKRRVDGSPK